MKILEQLEVESLDSIVERLNLVRVDHPDGRTILNYSQIDSPKYDPIVRECRGLVIDRNTNTLVARAFDRFYNYGEYPEGDKQFDWGSATVQEKVDGSLIVAYYWRGEWRFNTRGSFGDGQCGASGKSWSELVAEILREALLESEFTYVFEFCSPWNQVVAYHPEPKLYLLSMFCGPKELGKWAIAGGGRVLFDSSGQASFNRLEVPQIFSLHSATDCVEILKSDKFGPTFEGFVARDKHGNRVKIKSPRYVALHHLVDNGNIYLERRLVPLILAGEIVEVIQYFPDLVKRIWEVESMINNAVDSAVEVWDNADFTDQKSFALSVKGNKLSGLLFTAKKMGKHPREIVRDMGEYLTKCLFG